MDKTKFSRLAALRLEERKIKDEIDALLPEVKQLVDGMESGTEIVLEEGKFVVSYRRSWTYPEAIESARENLKTAEKTAQQTGDASYEEEVGITFRPTTIE